MFYSCKICFVSKSIESFVKDKNKPNGHMTRCKSCHSNITKEISIKKRLDWISKNGPCIYCGSKEKLEVDHIDPSTKQYEPSQIWSLKMKRQELELLKCQVLCHNCHINKTILDLKKINPIIHGTLSRYNAGCRCSSCKSRKSLQNEKRIR